MRLIEEAKAQHRKDVKDAKRSEKGRALAAANGGDAARIAAQLAADRAERAAAGPVSIARPGSFPLETAFLSWCMANCGLGAA